MSILILAVAVVILATAVRCGPSPLAFPLAAVGAASLLFLDMPPGATLAVAFVAIVGGLVSRRVFGRFGTRRES